MIIGWAMVTAVLVRLLLRFTPSPAGFVALGMQHTVLFTPHLQPTMLSKQIYTPGCHLEDILPPLQLCESAWWTNGNNKKSLLPVSVRKHGSIAKRESRYLGPLITWNLKLFMYKQPSASLQTEFADFSLWLVLFIYSSVSLPLRCYWLDEGHLK